MSEIIKCKRCNRPLKSKESQKVGYGPTCYRIVQLQEKEQKPQLSSEIQFLKVEINFLKNQFKILKNNGFIGNKSNINPIDRIKKEDITPEQNEVKVQFSLVIKDLKKLFEVEGDSFDFHQVLMPIEPRETIEEPPNISIVQSI